MLREKRTFWRKLLSLPSWERGLKSLTAIIMSVICIVAPLVGAWIEIVHEAFTIFEIDVAPLVGAWIEIPKCGSVNDPDLVAPLVGAWIEII